MPPRCSEKQKTASKAFKRSATNTPTKAIFHCGLACSALKNMNNSDAKKARKSQIPVLFDVSKSTQNAEKSNEQKTEKIQIPVLFSRRWLS